MHKSRPYNLAKPNTGIQKWLLPYSLDNGLDQNFGFFEASIGMIYIA